VLAEQTAPSARNLVCVDTISSESFAANIGPRGLPTKPPCLPARPTRFIFLIAVVKDMEEDLSHASFWDQRYANSGGDAPTHEWFKSFESLKPFFYNHLIERRRSDYNPRILHLGCGDSVSITHDLLSPIDKAWADPLALIC
jgi:hypothetical protein